MKRKLGLRIGAIGLSLILWIAWKAGAQIWNSPARAGIPLSQVIRENYYSFAGSGGKSLHCKFIPHSLVDIIDAEHTTAVDAATRAYFESRVGTFSIEGGTARVAVSPIDREHSDAVRTKTDLVVFEKEYLEVLNVFFNFGYVKGPVLFEADATPVKMFDMVFRAQLGAGIFRLSRNLRLLTLTSANDGTMSKFWFAADPAGRLIASSAELKTPAFPAGIDLVIDYDLNHLPTTITTTRAPLAGGSDVATRLTDRITDCVAE